MKETFFARYERKSTLWKNANMLYKMNDWTRMDCVYCDYSEERKDCVDIGLKATDVNGNDVTERWIDDRYYDRYVVRLYSTHRHGAKSFCFRTKDEANRFFLSVKNDKVFSNWKRVS